MLPATTDDSITIRNAADSGVLQPVELELKPPHEESRETPILPITSRSKTGANQPSLGWKLRPFRLLKEDAANLKRRYVSDWTTFNQQVVASAIYIFFTNILPGITFANDLNVLTGQSWGTIEVVFSTGLCGVIFALYAAIHTYQFHLCRLTH